MPEITQQQVVDYIKGISVLELSQLVKTLESELGVSAAAAMPMAMPMGGGGAAALEAPLGSVPDGDAEPRLRGGLVPGTPLPLRRGPEAELGAAADASGNVAVERRSAGCQ